MLGSCRIARWDLIPRVDQQSSLLLVGNLFPDRNFGKRSKTMTNEYEVAAVIELGKAQDIVLGEKVVDNAIDSLTLESGTRFIPAT